MKAPTEDPIFIGQALRRKVLRVSADLLVALFTAGRRSYEVVENALPDDAKVVGARYDSLRDEWEIAIESETFEPVEIAVPLPEMRPIVTLRTEQ